MKRITRAAVSLLLCAASSAAAAPAVTPATTQPGEAESLGVLAAEIVDRRDGVAFANLFDSEALVERVLAGMGADATDAMRVEVRSAVEAMLPEMASSQPAQTRCQFLRVRVVERERRLVCRIVTPTGMTYWEIVLADKPAGTAPPRGVDLYSAAAGELTSLTLQRLLVRALPGGKAPDAAAVQLSSDFTAFAQAARTGDPQDALARCEALPPSLRDDKATQLLRLLASVRLKSDPAAAGAAADEFRRRFGSDPACDLVLLDTYVARGQTAEALACIERLDASVGGDPYLDFVRSNVQAAGGDRAAARQSAARAFERDATLVGALNRLLTFALEDRDFAEAKRWLLTIERSPDLGIRFPADFGNNDLFAGFRASPEYGLWLRERPAAK